MTRLIILDRDGVINFDSPAFVKSPEEWRPIPRSLEAIAVLKREGWKVAVCTNQSGVGRGVVSPAALDAIHDRLHRALAELDVRLDGLAFCPHHPDEHCACRKPLPGLLKAMMDSLGVAPEQTVVVGDSERDIKAGKAAGCRCFLVRTGNGASSEATVRALGVDGVFDDLWSLALALREEEPCS